MDWHTWALKLISPDTVATDVVTAGVTRVRAVSAGVVVDSVCDGAVDTGVVGAVVGAMVPLLNVADVVVVEVAGAVAACESLGTTPAVTSVLVGVALVFATGKNSHIAS